MIVLQSIQMEYNFIYCVAMQCFNDAMIAKHKIFSAVLTPDLIASNLEISPLQFSFN